jgi:hypothetical protein
MNKKRFRTLAWAIAVLAILAFAFALTIPPFAKNRGGHHLSIDLQHFCWPLAGIAPTTQPSGQSLGDLQKSIEAAHAPNPINPFSHSRDLKDAVPVSVSVESRNAYGITFTHYVMQSDRGQADLFILPQSNFPYDSLPAGITETDFDNNGDASLKSFHVQVWSDAGFIFAEFTTPAKS